MRPVSTALIVACSLMFVGVIGVTTSAQNPGGSPEARKVVNPIKSSAESIEAGKTTYGRSCRGCHGPEAKGAGPSAPKTMTPPPDLTDAKWDRGSTDGEIFAVVREGAGPKFEMKGNKILKDEDIWNIVNFLRSVQVKK